ncbi:transporter [Amycolatopsis sp. SID8362]|uniref:transporter n=1 Tax=Amycolatopsis sp. SID8362 TaxID=2690346 RepID=UPI00136A4C11|nr:transporter [Amycolatopsis sp. SID8362]NBH12061.1 transporter [Amycolatopsis sp. SID8362]NED48752.1 transporter [Amycolatopsis sp. SID8362]
MKELLFMLADLWMIFAGFFYGVKFIRRYANYLLGLEWMIVATSGTNFLVWSLLGGDDGSFLYTVAYFFDAFSRSVGITLILVMGLMRVTHRYKPSLAADIGAFAVAIAAGAYLQQFRGEHLHVGPATFYIVVNVLTTLFLAYFSVRLWKIGAKTLAIAAGLATAAGTAIALTYDFFPFPDDQHRTVFYILALGTWGTQLFVYFRCYRALHEHNVRTGVEPASHSRSATSV